MLDLTPNPAIVGMTAGELRQSSENWDVFADTAIYPGCVAGLRNEATARRLQADALDASPFASVPEDFKPHLYL